MILCARNHVNRHDVRVVWGTLSREGTLVSLYWNGLSDVHILEIDK